MGGAASRLSARHKQICPKTLSVVDPVNSRLKGRQPSKSIFWSRTHAVHINRTSKNDLMAQSVHGVGHVAVVLGGSVESGASG